MILMTWLLTACGGGGGGSDSVDTGTSGDTVASTGITTGIAVDPYIVNAEFEEIAADGRSLQQSTKSTANGLFFFENEIAEGSTIKIRSTVKGQHGNADFQGVIKRLVANGESGPVVVSPLTTLLANGMSSTAVIHTMTSAGLPGLTEASLYTNPMDSLTINDLVLLQANMAVNTFMVATQKFDYSDPTTVVGAPVSFNDIVAVVQGILNPVLYQQMVSTHGANFTVVDLTNAAASINNTVAIQIRQHVAAGNSTVPATIIVQIATNAMDSYFNGQGGTTDPGTGTGGGTTTPPTTSTPDAQAIFTANCSGCHTVGTGTGITELAGDGTKVSGKFGNGSSHNDNTLTADEITAMAAHFDSQSVTTDPGTGTGGGTTTPPATACDSCHGQPPSGTTFPNTAGAHGPHSALTDIGSTCDNCHSGAAHNDWVDLGFLTKWNAQSGAATDNMDGTCSSIICHGGQRTPDWTTGSINVETQCRSCHEYNTTQYNSFSSGEHSRHAESRSYACTVCHDTAKLQNGHFSNLSTTAFEQDPADTINNSMNYNGQSCNPSCHGSENW